MKPRLAGPLGDPKHGFTLVELLVVIAIIGILIALLLPAVQQAREAARRTECLGNLKQIGLAILTYSDSNRESLPPGGITEGPCCGTRSGTSWTISILPFLEQQNLYDRYDFREFNESPVNEFVRTSFVDVYTCPSDEDTRMLDQPASGPGAGLLYARGSYRGSTGRGDGGGDQWWDSPNQVSGLPVGWKGALHIVWKNVEKIEKPVKLKDITDGTSNTLLVGEMTTVGTSEESRRRRTFWAYTYTSYNKSSVVPQTRTLLVDFDRCVQVGGVGGENPCKRAWGSFHPNGLNFVYCDGSVRFISTNVDMEMFARMATISGGDIIQVQ